MIPFTCPHCGLFTEVEDQYAGLSGSCYACGKTISVPAIGGRPIGAAHRLAVHRPAEHGPAVRQSLSPTGEQPGTIAKRSPAAIVVTAAAAVLLTFGCLAGLALYYFTPLAGMGKEIVARSQCEDNLARIGQALHAYEQDYGVFPPAYLPDEKGKPKHSWRVLILPYLGERQLYAQYNFAEPWDGPNNIALAGLMPAVYSCPGDSDAMAIGETVYLAVVGKNTMFPGASSRRLGDVSDGQDATILVVESHGTAISWTQPTDLDSQNLTYDVNSGADGEIGGNHDHGAYAVMVDGRVRLLKSSMPPEMVEALLSPQGGEAISPEYLGN